LFGQVTDERYVRLIQQSGDFLVIDQHENRVEVEKLSQGTAEQLYLCLRLGLIQEFARQSTNLPLIMDDVFVNFDPERARRVAELLVGFSSNHQVLLFTCHPQTAELLREVQPNVRIVTMPRYGGYSSPRLDRRASMSQREPSEDPREVILACLQASEEAIGKTEILRRTGLGDGAWGAAIATLKAEGVVEQQGEKRGAVYRRVTAMSQNKEVFTDAAVLD
jgi:predicted transcriptional regulator